MSVSIKKFAAGRWRVLVKGTAGKDGAAWQSEARTFTVERRSRIMPE